MTMGTGTRHDLTGRTFVRPHVHLFVAVTLASGLAGCADSLPSLPKLGDLNPFAEKQQPLPGKRVPIMAEGSKIGGDLATADKPITLPPPVANDSWSQPGGTPANAPGHLNLNSTLKVAWTASAGNGSSKAGKLSASPIVYDGKIYTLDAAGTVTAFGNGGSIAWRFSVKPEGEKNAEKGYGGGLAADGGRIFIGTGYGTVVALDAKSGKKFWEQSVGVPVRSSPSAAGDRVFVVTTDGVLYCLSAADGSEVWTFKGVPEKASLVNNASPAIDGDTVVAPFSSGDVVALKISTGQVMWTESLARTRSASSLASMSDAARPVVDGGMVFAVGHAGRMIATSARTGERQWAITVPSLQQPWVIAETIFVIDTTGQIMAVTRRDGKVQWTAKLPGQGVQWSGPVLAGGKLWAVSSKGVLVGVEAQTGKVSGTLELGGEINIAPVVAGGRMYVLTDSAKLIALN